MKTTIAALILKSIGHSRNQQRQ